MTGEHILISNGAIEVAIASYTPGTDPTSSLSSTASILCQVQQLKVRGEVQTTEVKYGCGSIVSGIQGTKGSATLTGLTPTDGWNFQNGSGGTPEAMAVRIKYKENTALGSFRSLYGIIKTWEGTMDVNNPTVETIEIELRKTGEW